MKIACPWGRFGWIGFMYTADLDSRGSGMLRLRLGKQLATLKHTSSADHVALRVNTYNDIDRYALH